MIYIFLAFSFWLLINLYFRLADRFNIIDKPNLRSSHTEITIRGGGIVFLFSAVAFYIVFGYQYPFFVLGLFAISCVSFLDDLYELSNKVRLLVHFASLSCMFYELGLFELPPYTYLPLYILVIGIFNAYNFMDGINGITGLYSLSVLAGLYLINEFVIEFVDTNLIYTTALSLFVFNLYNVRKKAKCFAGDVGSLAIAFILLFLIVKLAMSHFNVSIVLLLAVYGIDSVLTILHRLSLKENIFKAHRKHCYQILANEAKVAHVRVSIYYALVQFLIGILVFASYYYETSFLISIGITISVLGILALVYYKLKFKYYHLHQG